VYIFTYVTCFRSDRSVNSRSTCNYARERERCTCVLERFIDLYTRSIARGFAVRTSRFWEDESSVEAQERERERSSGAERGARRRKWKEIQCLIDSFAPRSLCLSVGCLSTCSSLHTIHWIPISRSNQFPHVARAGTREHSFYYYFQLPVGLRYQRKNTNRDTKDTGTKVTIATLISQNRKTRARQIEGKCAIAKLYVLSAAFFIFFSNLWLFLIGVKCALISWRFLWSRVRTILPSSPSATPFFQRQNCVASSFPCSSPSSSRKYEIHPHRRTRLNAQQTRADAPLTHTRTHVYERYLPDLENDDARSCTCTRRRAHRATRDSVYGSDY